MKRQNVKWLDLCSFAIDWFKTEDSRAPTCAKPQIVYYYTRKVK